MANRLVRPADVLKAASWYFGFAPEHNGARPSERHLRAKRVYWAALENLGLSRPEIAHEVGADVSTIRYELKSDVPKCWIDGVLERAREQVEAE